MRSFKKKKRNNISKDVNQEVIGRLMVFGVCIIMAKELKEPEGVLVSKTSSQKV